MASLLTTRALNRALLERQYLLARTDRVLDDTIEDLVGMQAQAPLAPYVGLWTRLANFRPDDLSARIEDRRVVRVTATLRTTIHLFTSADALRVRPVLQPVLERGLRSSPFARNLDGADIDAVVAAGREILESKPRALGDLAKQLGERWPDRDAVSLAYAVRYLLPLVQVPPRGVWGSTSAPRLTTLESWLGRQMDPERRPDELVFRYLVAYGPASVADVAAWSWLTGVREVIERLRPRLRLFRDESGRELFDVPDGRLPDADTPAPARFLPEYDNALLSHADRARVIPPGRKVPLPPGNGATMGTFLVDGFLRGTWKLMRGSGSAAAVLRVEPDTPLQPRESADVETEADALVRFIAPDATDVAVQIATMNPP